MAGENGARGNDAVITSAGEKGATESTSSSSAEQLAMAGPAPGRFSVLQGSGGHHSPDGPAPPGTRPGRPEAPPCGTPGARPGHDHEMPSCGTSKVREQQEREMPSCGTSKIREQQEREMPSCGTSKIREQQEREMPSCGTSKIREQQEREMPSCGTSKIREQQEREMPSCGTSKIRSEKDEGSAEKGEKGERSGKKGEKDDGPGDKGEHAERSSAKKGDRREGRDVPDTPVKDPDAPKTREELHERWEAIKDAPIPKEKGDRQMLENEVVELLYWSRHKLSTDEYHQLKPELERRFNDVKRAGDPNWVDRYDCRDDYHFTIIRENGPNGEKTTRIAVETQRVHPDRMIKWRDHTKLGWEIAVRTQSYVNQGTGDDGGHLTKHGADPAGVNAGRIDENGLDPATGKPADVANITRQNPSMNRGVFKQNEDAITDLRRGGRTGDTLTVVSVSEPDGRGGERETGRTAVLTDANGRPVEYVVNQKDHSTGKSHPAIVQTDRLIYLNSSHPKLRERAGTPDHEAATEKKDNVIYHPRFGPKKD